MVKGAKCDTVTGNVLEYFSYNFNDITHCSAACSLAAGHTVVSLDGSYPPHGVSAAIMQLLLLSGYDEWPCRDERR